MQNARFFSLALILGCIALTVAVAQVSSKESVSSDDISVAEGLQLPTYGHVWALDTWKGLRELVRLSPPDTTTDDSGFSLKLRHVIGFKGEAAKVRVHDPAASFFLRGVSGNDNDRCDLVIVRLNADGQRREVTKDGMAQLKQRAKHGEGQYPDVISIKQQRIGTTDWYRLSPLQTLSPGEYALVPLPSSPGFAEGEVFDFAVDPEAPENADPLRSELYRGAQ
ncbi:MAG TPA: hypothetical protein VMB49_21965 [Acidobacteriaceae bacterium]|nr:hypothetical protein [Acidobacteriaceae bacterium]